MELDSEQRRDFVLGGFMQLISRQVLSLLHVLHFTTSLPQRDRGNCFFGVKEMDSNSTKEPYLQGLEVVKKHF